MQWTGPECARHRTIACHSTDRAGYCQYRVNHQQNRYDTIITLRHTHTHTHTVELQIEECKRNSEELEEMIRRQPMSSKEVVEIRQRIRESHELLDKYRSMVDDWNQQISELQMKHNRYWQQLSFSAFHLAECFMVVYSTYLHITEVLLVCFYSLSCPSLSGLCQVLTAHAVLLTTSWDDWLYYYRMWHLYLP